MIKFDKITTRGGDRGETSLYDGQRLRKDSPVFEALGDMDELFSYLGVVRASGPEEVWKRRVEKIQEDLLILGSTIATAEDSPKKRPQLEQKDVERLEEWEKELMANREIEGVFVRPGANLPSAHAHVARTMARRLERRLVTAIRDKNRVNLIPAQRYVNRLSDLLYLLARHWESAPDRGK